MHASFMELWLRIIHMRVCIEENGFIKLIWELYYQRCPQRYCVSCTFVNDHMCLVFFALDLVSLKLMLQGGRLQISASVSRFKYK